MENGVRRLYLKSNCLSDQGLHKNLHFGWRGKSTEYENTIEYGKREIPRAQWNTNVIGKVPNNNATFI